MRVTSTKKISILNLKKETIRGQRPELQYNIPNINPCLSGRKTLYSSSFAFFSLSHKGTDMYTN